MPTSARFLAAVQFASAVHADQTRKGGTVPYVSHVLGVASLVQFYGGNEDQAIAGLLHDTVEDARPPFSAASVRATILKDFGPDVLAIVEGCTDADTDPKPPWLARKVAYVDHVVTAGPDVVLVSAADKLHNATAILSDVREYGDALWARFNPAAGKAGTIGYYRGLVTAYRATGHHRRVIDDLDRVVADLESAAECQGVWPPDDR